MKTLFWKLALSVLSVAIASDPAAAAAKLTWADTKFLFTFGDSYTTDGFNISAGVNSPVPGFVGVGCCCTAKPRSHAG